MGGETRQKGLGQGEKNGFFYRQQHKIHYIPKQWWREKGLSPFQHAQCPQQLHEWRFQLARLEQITSEVASLIDKTDRDAHTNTNKGTLARAHNEL